MSKTKNSVSKSSKKMVAPKRAKGSAKVAKSRSKKRKVSKPSKVISLAQIKIAPKHATKRARSRRIPDSMPRYSRKPPAKSFHVFWSTGMLGGIMVVTAALWSAWRTPLPAPGAPAAVAASSTSQTTPIVPMDRSPASADPPQPSPPAQSIQPAPQNPQQQQLQKSSEVVPSPALSEAFSQVAQASPEHRVSWWSHWLARESGSIKELESIGKGPETGDTAPLIPQSFDCTTFVETVAALARSDQPQSFFQRLIEIRYRDGKPGYLSRNHFPEADWVPNNISAGVIKDITAQVAESSEVELQIGTKTLDRARWLATQRQQSPSVSRALAEAGPPDALWGHSQKVRVSYIPSQALPKVAASIPDGVVVNFVRKNEAKRPVLISHQGILVRLGGKVWLRHAAPGGRVRTVVLRDYLRRNTCFVGFTLNQVNDRAQGVNS